MMTSSTHSVPLISLSLWQSGSKMLETMGWGKGGEEGGVKEELGRKSKGMVLSSI